MLERKAVLRRAFDKAVRRKPLVRRTRALWVLNVAQDAWEVRRTLLGS
jgi:hypothetical protein